MALNEENQVIEDMSLSLSQGHINDVTFQLSDGRTEANRTILTIRSEYFRTMFLSHFRLGTEAVMLKSDVILLQGETF